MRSIRRAARTLREGGVVVFPTETVYGIGANALDDRAVDRLFQIKGRPSANPIIVHLAELEWLDRVAQDIPSDAVAIFRAFAPGPITVVIPARESLPRRVTSGLSTVGVRIPSHPVAQRLLRLADLPIAAPSANRSGEPSATSLTLARRALGDSPDFYLRGGRSEVGLESTVVSCGEVIRILRPGAIGREDLERALPGATILDPTMPPHHARTLGGAEGVPATHPHENSVAAISPGTSFRHYQPKAKVVLYNSLNAPEVTALIKRERCGVIAGREAPVSHGAAAVRRFSDSDELSRNLYRWFWDFDRIGMAVILAPLPEGGGIAVALRDRLLRSSDGAIVG